MPHDDPTREELAAFEDLVARTYALQEPVLTLADLETIDHDDAVAGYTDARRGVKAPGHNRSRSYVQGWLNGAVDQGVWPRAEMDRRNRELFRDCTSKPEYVDRMIALDMRRRAAVARETAREHAALVRLYDEALREDAARQVEGEKS